MKKSVTLIGMPGAGKSTVGVLLAKSLLADFADTDLIIQRETGKSLCEIIEREGTERFLEAENRIICSQSFDRAVIATGGSAVYGEEAMEKLKSISTVVYLSLPVEELEKRIKDIHTRGVAMKNGVTLRELYEERRCLYEKYADITVECNGLTAEECVEKIINMI
ncbi:MAG: shikimate kinase [Ruminococcaceae bacterium]|nr:shikimate kinase [Oscillospiraceae bacterium]MBQ9913242.1 shikimate kinase [Clostridia bacterium]